MRGVERGAGAPRCRLARVASKGILEHLHTVLAQRANAGLPTASAAAAVPAATSHRQVERFTRPGRSNFASRGPRTAVHCTGSGGIYTRLSRLAGRTSHAAIRQYVHPQRRRRPRVDGRNAFRDHELTGVGRGAGQRFGTVSATTSPRELPIPRRHRRAPIKAYCSHVSGGDQRVALAHYNYWPASCCARGNRNQVTRSSPTVSWR